MPQLGGRPSALCHHEPMPESPYRDDDKALRDLIPPDDRRKRAAMLVAASMVAGGAVVLLGQQLLRSKAEPTPPPLVQPIPLVAGRIGPVTLTGPGGTYRVPGDRPMVLHVWLQGCADCMPAFDSMFALQSTGGMRLPVDEINVSYGRADEAWARDHGVSKGLVYDIGGRDVVRALGIDTFTTLVVDTRGQIVHKDRPDRVGYAVRVEEALRKLGCYPGGDDKTGFGCAPALEPIGTAEPPPLGPKTLQEIVAARSRTIREKCWSSGPGDGLASAHANARIVIAAGGGVANVEVTGTSPELNGCIANEVRRWEIPNGGREAVTLNVPFRFSRAEPRP